MQEQTLNEQIYNKLKSRILSGEIPPGTKLPSLREVARSEKLSMTTVTTAFNQLVEEGFIESVPRFGYRVKSDLNLGLINDMLPRSSISDTDLTQGLSPSSRQILYDASSFDFAPWKTCMHKVYSKYLNQLQMPAAKDGEPMLQSEIAAYLAKYRGVKVKPSNIIISAGKSESIDIVNNLLKTSGYSRSRYQGLTPSIYQENCKRYGIEASLALADESGPLSQNLSGDCVLFVNPSNVYPSGKRLPVARRYELIKECQDLSTYIIEDDSDGVFEFNAKASSSLLGMDASAPVILLGTFENILFASCHINYIILPDSLILTYQNLYRTREQYQSKDSQLCLALYMHEGHFDKHLKKVLRSYQAKLKTCTSSMTKMGLNRIQLLENQGNATYLIIQIDSSMTDEEIIKLGQSQGLLLEPLSLDGKQYYRFAYNRLPLAMMGILIKQFDSKLK